jgi:glycosyltransferase involved in cell wall biosynthesis
MLNNKKIAIVLPAYNAGKTLERTISDIPDGFVDEIILVDDFSKDNTFDLANKLGLTCIRHESNQGYGGNQKTCYQAALDTGADVIIMLHPDYQYDPKLTTAMAAMITSGVYDVVLGSRILGMGAIKGGMPKYKYIANRILTLLQNILISQKLSEYHTGYRAFSREILEDKQWMKNSNDFVFDNQILIQLHHKGARFGEISCPTRYFEEASSISFSRSVTYGFGVLNTSIRYRLHKWGLFKYRILE